MAGMPAWMSTMPGQGGAEGDGDGDWADGLGPGSLEGGDTVLYALVLPASGSDMPATTQRQAVAGGKPAAGSAIRGVAAPISSDSALHAEAQAVCAEVNTWAGRLCRSAGYVWQDQPFRLRVVRAADADAEVAAGKAAARAGRSADRDSAHAGSAASSRGAAGAHPYRLVGHTHYGDSIDDEWFVTWLLAEATRRYGPAGEQGAGASSVVADGDVASNIRARGGLTAWATDAGDGDFLAVQAADHLPRWAKPSTTAHRIFLYNGAVHMVAPNALPAVASLDEGAAYVRAHAGATLASPGVQADVMERLRGYPKAAASRMHTARCFLPARLARLVSVEPLSVAQAVACFYTRDPLDVRLAARMPRFHPAGAPTRPAPGATGDGHNAATVAGAPAAVAALPSSAHAPAAQAHLVPVSVRLNRSLFAQLAQQRYLPPKPYAALLPPQSAPAHEGHVLGAKLAAGYEILFARGEKAASQGAPSATTTAGDDEGGDAEATTINVALRLLATLARIDAAAAAGTWPAGFVSSLSGAPVQWPPAADVDDDPSVWMDGGEGAEAQLAALMAEMTAAAAAAEPATGKVAAAAPAVLRQKSQAAASAPGSATGGDDDDADAAQLRALLSSMAGFVTRSSGLEGVEVTGTPQKAAQEQLPMGGALDEGVDGGGATSDGDTSGEDEDENEDEDEDEVEDAEADDEGGEPGSSDAEQTQVRAGQPAATAAGTHAGTASSRAPASAAGKPVDVEAFLAHLRAHTAIATGAATASTAVLRFTRDDSDDELMEVGDAAPWLQRPTGAPQPVPAAATSRTDGSLSLADYMGHLDGELAGAGLTSSFTRFEAGSAASPAAPATAGAGGDSARAAAGATTAGTGPLSEHDVRFNLAASLAASVGAQAGAAGPASNLLGQLGLAVPREWWAGEEDAKAQAAGTGHNGRDDHSTAGRPSPAGTQAPNAQSAFTVPAHVLRELQTLD
jgi:hypothetical protein